MHVIATLTLIEPNRAYTATIVRGPYLLLLGGRDWRDKQLNRVRTANPCLLVQLSTASDVYRTFHSKDVIQLVEWLLGTSLWCRQLQSSGQKEIIKKSPPLN